MVEVADHYFVGLTQQRGAGGLARIRGHGAITLHEETTPSSIARIVARFAEWHMPASSAWMIR